MTRRIVVGISGATGIAYALAALELARKAGCETHLVVTPTWPRWLTSAIARPTSGRRSPLGRSAPAG
jgi:3-polyprenyl-4-hydroxybenzoate decarboxylase